MVEIDPIVKRLDVLIRLMLDQQIKEGKVLRKDQLLFMDSVGLTSGEIGKILGQSSKDIASQLNSLKKKGKTG